MNKKQYNLKWGIAYKDKVYLQVYGKKKAHNLLYKLSYCLTGLRIKELTRTRFVPKEERKKVNAYYKSWREKNREKLREYGERYRARNPKN